jgi:hypothetical protein
MRREDIIGAWRLEEFRLVDTKGGVTKPWGPGSVGLLMYTPDGFMAASIRSEDKTRGTNFMGYSGPFEIGVGRVEHHVKVSSDPKLIGTTQVRKARLEGGKLILSSAVSLYGGPGTSAELVWRRA